MYGWFLACSGVYRWCMVVSWHVAVCLAGIWLPPLTPWIAHTPPLLSPVIEIYNSIDDLSPMTLISQCCVLVSVVLCLIVSEFNW